MDKVFIKCVVIERYYTYSVAASIPGVTYHHTVSSHMDVRSYTGCIDNGIFSNNDIVTNLQGVKGTSLEGGREGRIKRGRKGGEERRREV